MTQTDRYDVVAMLLHWLTALAVIGLLVVGNQMADMPRTDPLKLVLFNMHKSLGVSVFVLTLLRLAWRLTHRPPPLPDTMPDWEKRVAHLTHWAFYGLLLGVPLLGWVMVSAAPRSVPTLLFGSALLPHLPGLVDLDLETKKDYKELFETAHAAAAYCMAGLILLHVGAVLRHRFLLKDRVASRMLPRFLPMLALAAWVGAAPVAAAEWSVDSVASSLGFIGSQSGKSFEGRFKNWQADIAFDPANPAAGHARVVIDMTSAVTGDRQKDISLPESDWFDAKRTPQAIFAATGFTAKGGNRFEAVGSLSIRGMTKTVTLPFSLEIVNDVARAKGRLDLVRTDFGVGQGEWADGTYVALAVAVVFDLTARKKS